MAESNNGEDTDTNTDRISSLPDSVLHHILSFLPTKTSVKMMSLVSRRWRYLWKHLQVLDFNDDYHYMAADHHLVFQHFTVFVNAVLALRRSRDIRKMRLSSAHSQSDAFYAHSVDTWLRTAIGPHLEELYLTFFSIDGHGFRLPLTILTCPLVSLSLCGGILLQLQHSSGICLPSLKTLQLEIYDVDVDSVNALLSACPILETLELSFSPQSLGKVRAPPSLKTLKVTVENKIGTYIEIDTPNLKYLRITGTTFGYAAGNLHNVDEAYLDVFSSAERESVDPLLNLLRALSSGIKHLVLPWSTTKWLFAALDIDFPEFRYLIHLELDLPSFNLSFLFDVLQKCPMLQALIIQNFEDPSPPSYGCVTQPTSVPNCLLSHLTYIHFIGYVGFPDELAFAEYILRKGLVLKMLIIDDVSVDQLSKRLSDIPRGSAMCQLKFD